MDKGKEQLQYFNKGLKNVIDSFEKAREWADLSACLQRVKRQIDQNKGLPIPRQRDLAKRLAQCLNPDINVIHQLTLEVYRDVFEREVELMEKEMETIEIYERKSSIALFFSGLFNFYQFAAFEVKQSFLELIRVYLLKMKKELILSLPGFILCMLPALEDQNGEILKRVEAILYETEKIVGTSEFYGEIWKAMLRTPRARLSAIKYLEKKIPHNLKHAREIRDRKGIYISDYTIKIVNHEVSLSKDQAKKMVEENMKQKMELHDYFYFYYPNKSKLIMNALIAGLSITQEQVPVNRGTLDFLISHMPLNSPINSIQENIRLVECATLAYTKKDFATLNKISNWLFSHIDEDEEEIDSRDPTIITIVESQKNLFRKSMDLQQNALIGPNKINEQVGVNQFNNIDKLIVNTINVLLRILSDEQNTTVPILKNLSIPLIKFIKFHLTNRNADLQKFKQNIENLIDQIAPYYKAVLESLDTKLQQEIENLDYNADQAENMHIESIDLISFAITVMNDLSKNKLMQSENSQLYLIQIMSNLLRGMNKLSNENQNMDIIAPSLDVIEQILDILYQYQKGKMLHQQRTHPKFRESIESFNNLYIMISRKLLSDFSNNLIQDNLQGYKHEFDCFNKYNYIMVKIFQFQNVDSTTYQMPQWLDMLIQSSKVKCTQICTISIERFLDLLKMQDQTNQPGGGAISNIQRLIAGDQNRAKNIFTTDKKIENQNIFKQEFFQFLQNSEQRDESEELKNGHTHCKEIIRNLWYLLGKEIDTENSVRQLKEFEQHVPRIVSDVIIEDLRDKDDREKQDDAIKKFAIFWKHTAQEYPSYKPFESEISGKKYLVLHNMINFLEDTDPTLRLSCRSWLSQNKQFNRILDPIIEEFIKNSNFKITGNNNVVIVGDFETQYVIENFGKLRNIILSQDDIFEYILLKHCLPQYHRVYLEKYQQNLSAIKQNDQNIFNIAESNNQIPQSMIPIDLIRGEHYNNPRESSTESYLFVLVQITLHFIRAEYSQEQISGLYGNAPKNQNQLATTLTVNASACEFMELILKQAEKYFSFCNKITHIIIKPLIDTFYHIIEKKNYAMQVNIINLLYSILNDCNFQGDKIDNQSDRKQQENSTIACINIFKSSKLIDSIILGLKCDVSFVRQRFIKFVEMYIPYLRNFTKIHESFQDTFKLHVEKLVDCMCSLLRRVDITQFSTTLKKKNQLVTMSRRETQRDKATISNRPSIGFSKQITQKDISGGAVEQLRLSFGENGSVIDPSETMLINQESDILMIIGGLQRIINTCLDIKFEGQQIVDEPNEDELNEEEQIRIGRLSKSDSKKNQGFFTKMFGGGETSYFAPDVFQEVRKSIHDKMSDILISCVHCWNHVEHFNQIDYHFTRFGQFPYYGEYSKIIMDQIKFKKDKETISKGGQPQINDKMEDLKKQTLEDYMTLNLNAIQKKVLQLLRPIAKKIPDQFIEGTLHVWLRKSLLGNVDINRSYEKIIQILICVQQAVQNQKQSNKIDFILPVHQVIQSLIKYIQTRKPQEALVNVQRWVKNNNPALQPTHTSSETLLNSFLYAYLCYNPSMFDPMFESRSEDKQKEFQKVYAILIKYFNVFKTSRNPFTINWLLEILNIVCVKYQMTETKLDSRLKKEYHDLFNSILTNCSQIITDTFKITFHEQQVYSLALPPSIYEILWRYEYISFKNSINESGDLINVNESKNQSSKLSNVQRQLETKNQNKLRQQEIQDQKIAQEKNQLKGYAQTNIVAKNGSLFFNKSILKMLVEQRFEFQYSGTNANNDISVSKSMEVLYKERSQLSDEYMLQSDFLERIKFSLRGETHPDELLYQSQFFIIMTLKWVFCQLLVNLVGISDSEKTNASLQILMQTVIQILQENKLNKEKQQSQAAQKMEEVMNEFIMDFFSSMVQQCHQLDSNLIKPYKKDIIELFNQDNFFQVSMINLKQWQKIIKCFNEGKPDEMFDEQMLKWNFQGGLFANNNTVIVQRCYAMKRIAFLIFSCGDDDFCNQLDTLMKKMIESFKQRQKEKSDIKQRIFVFFLTRVILIRLNFQNLTEALRKLWPHLLNELISVFEIKQEQSQQNGQLDKENTDLTIEAIKLVELLSSLNMEDFQMNQWIFLIDGYGMLLQSQADERAHLNQSELSEPGSIISQSIQNNSKLQEARRLSTNIGASKIANQRATVYEKDTHFESADIFKTFIVRFIGNQEYSFYNVETPQDGNDKSIIENYFNSDIQEARDLACNANQLNTAQRSQNGKNIKNLIPGSLNDSINPQSESASFGNKNVQVITDVQSQFIVTKPGEFDARLQEQACKLQQSINDSNVTGNEFNRQEAESKIEIDFLKNDDILRLQ